MGPRFLCCERKARRTTKTMRVYPGSIRETPGANSAAYPRARRPRAAARGLQIPRPADALTSRNVTFSDPRESMAGENNAGGRNADLIGGVHEANHQCRYRNRGRCEPYPPCRESFAGAGETVDD